MSKALWFLIAILLCSSLAAEALICNRRNKCKIGSGCMNKKLKTCIAKPGQKCKVTYYEGKSTDFFAQGCTKSNDECHLTLGQVMHGILNIECCDDGDFCNTP